MAGDDDREDRERTDDRIGGSTAMIAVPNIIKAIVSMKAYLRP